MLLGLHIPLALALAAPPQNPQVAESVATTAHARAPSVRAAPLRGSIAVDGRLNEPDWATAPPATRFTQTDPVEGQPATERTDVRVLVGQDAIYVGARLYDSEAARVKAALARRVKSSTSSTWM